MKKEKYVKKTLSRMIIPVVLAAVLLSACGGKLLVTPAPKTEQSTPIIATPSAGGETTGGDVTGLPEGYLSPAGMVDGNIVLPEVDAAAFDGTVVTAGSSTVFPLSERMAERFQEEGFAGQITVDSIGSGAGFERFCVAGETDVSNASRPIRSSEVENCQKIGRTPIEFRVGTDALAVVMSRDNDFVDNLTLEELALAFSTAEKWSDIRPEWPDQPILRFSPGTDSGTFDFFVEHVFNKDEAPLLNASNINLSEDDNVLVQGVEGSPYAIGYFGFAYYTNNADRLKAVPIEGVEPSGETAESGVYPLSRPLFIYSDAKIMHEKPQVAAFIAFYLNRVNDEILDVGYFPASAEALNQSKQKWLNAMEISIP